VSNGDWLTWLGSIKGRISFRGRITLQKIQLANLLDMACWSGTEESEDILYCVHLAWIYLAELLVLLRIRMFAYTWEHLLSICCAWPIPPCTYLQPTPLDVMHVTLSYLVHDTYKVHQWGPCMTSRGACPCMIVKGGVPMHDDQGERDPCMTSRGAYPIHDIKGGVPMHDIRGGC